MAKTQTSSKKELPKKRSDLKTSAAKKLAKVKVNMKAKKKSIVKPKTKAAAKAKVKEIKKKLKSAPKKITKSLKTFKKEITRKLPKSIKEKNIVKPSEPVPAEKKIRKFKPNKKVRYTKSELKHFREIILQERKAIFESAKANMDALVDKDGEYKGDNLTYSSHMAEQGTDEMEREKNYLFVQRDEKYLGYLQDALMRIDQGTYGICIDCRDEPKNLCRSCPLIIKERLELVPITQHCIECKNLIRG